MSFIVGVGKQVPCSRTFLASFFFPSFTPVHSAEIVLGYLFHLALPGLSRLGTSLSTSTAAHIIVLYITYTLVPSPDVDMDLYR